MVWPPEVCLRSDMTSMCPVQIHASRLTPGPHAPRTRGIRHTATNASAASAETFLSDRGQAKKGWSISEM